MPITINGASEHNLQDVDVEFGSGLTVVTGVSGSGKTSLVFDTLYHEARRRFLDIFTFGSPGERLSPARVRSIEGLGPAVAVGQNLLNRNPVSTLATASGLHPFLRLLYANFGERSCPRCGAGLLKLADDAILERLVASARQEEVVVYAPLLSGVPGSHRTLLELLSGEFEQQRLQVDGRPWDGTLLDAALPHSLEVEIARLEGEIGAAEARQAVEQAKALGATALGMRSSVVSSEVRLALAPVCSGCGLWFDPLEPAHFHLACPSCEGRGCVECSRTGLHPQAAAVRWNGLRLPDLLARSVAEVRGLFTGSALGDQEEHGDRFSARNRAPSRLESEIVRRLEALQDVGLGYLTLDRPSPTLSRGEAQRVRLATALTNRLEDILHVLDEPTIGQHPADVARLLPVFRRLAGPVVYVEHDRIAAAAADRAIDLGPGAGSQGGRLLYQGTLAGLWETDTPTGRYFSLRSRVQPPALRPSPDRFLTVRGARLRNLWSFDAAIPIGRLTVVTGVSGSGKSTFVEEVLVASLLAREPVGCAALEGPALMPVLVDQSPIGINPRSNPATYTKLADFIREMYAAATGLSASHFSFNRPEGACPACEGMGALEVQMRYLPSTWIPCAACGGQRFSEEVLAARAKFGGEQLSIADFYRMPVAEVLPLISAGTPGQKTKSLQAALRILEALRDVGLGYLPLGQPSPTLSGGEAQRVKLAKYLGREQLENRLLVLDEPSTGLHPQDVAGLLAVLDRLVRSGATIVVVEHNTDMIRAADWVIDLGPGAGVDGGRLIYSGGVDGLVDVDESLTGRALKEEGGFKPGEDGHEIAQGAGKPSSRFISIRRARAHSLKNVNVDIPKGKLTVVTGVSGSGKSSLVGDVLEAEARRRFLETLSMYERQSTREGPEAPVDSVSGLGVAVAIGPERGRYSRRATVGTHTELSHHLAALLSSIGERVCLECGAAMRRVPVRLGTGWACPACKATAPLAEPRHFSPTTYAAACRACHGVGSHQEPRPEKLIIHPEKPLLDGAMYSPGFFPQGYLGKPFNGGYDMLQALARRYAFDPFQTPWNRMSPEAQHAYLFGDPEPMEVTFRSRAGRVHTGVHRFPGFYGFIRDWDVGGTYTETVPCSTCKGAGLRPEYLAVTLAGLNVNELNRAPLVRLAAVLQGVEASHPIAATSLQVVQQRLRFLIQVGLGYLHLDRTPSTLSAGEAQRVKLAGLLGSGLTALTVLLDEPSRGLHPSEVEALKNALYALRDEGNTVIVVEHDAQLILAADHCIDMGPGAGAQGGRVVYSGPVGGWIDEETGPVEDSGLSAPSGGKESITGKWLRRVGAGRFSAQAAFWNRPRRAPHGWIEIRGARANNLRGDTIRFPLGMLVGVCGPSGSGKSTLVIDTLGRALAPKKQTTSVAYEPVAPGEHDAILAAPDRVILVDQARAGVTNPADFLGLSSELRRLWASSEDARALGLDEKALGRGCSACGGSGAIKTDLGFLPDMTAPCDVCRGTGFLPEAWEVRLYGKALPEVYSLTIDEAAELVGEDESLARPLSVARQVGLGYLVLRQPGYSLSGGEAQRLKIAQELGREPRASRKAAPTLYLLDEPTVGQHMEDVARLVGVLHRLADAGHTILVVEHHPHLLASCDWLVELGPGGGPDGGQVVAAGTPEELARQDTATAQFIREILGE